MTSPREQERLVKPSDLRGRRPRHTRRRDWFDALGDMLTAAIAAILH